jgi:hypothetical protein
MMPGPDGSAMPLQPTELGDGDIMGDGILGPQTPDSVKNPATNTNSVEMQGEAAIRENLLTQAYGTKIPQRRVVDKG